MLFCEFATIFEHLTTLTTVGDIAAYINAVTQLSKIHCLELWIYRFLSFEQKCKINDKHLVTVFSKIREPHIDRQNLLDMFRQNGVEETCSNIPNYSAKPSLTIQEAYNFLNVLERLPTKSSTLLKHFKNILAKCDKNSVKCLIGLMRNNNKGKRIVCKKRNLYLFKQIYEKYEFDKSFGQPIEPMLAHPCKSLDYINLKTYCVEPKYDGERLQIHKFNNKITFYKRNLNENTKCYDLIETLQLVLSHVSNVVLDCELLPTKQIVVFDLMYLNNRCLINYALEDRKMLLHKIIKNQDKTLLLIEYKLCDTKTDVAMVVSENLKLYPNLEGMMVKDWQGPYEPKKKKWYKIKRCYFNNVCSADLVVLGGWKKDKKIVVYLVGTPVKHWQTGDWSFLPVSKVKLAKYNLEDQMEPYDSEKCSWLIQTNYLSGKIPNMVAKNPFSMPVWEIQGDFIRTRNELWQRGDILSDYVSVRLPRFIRVRDDKNYESATRMFELKILCSITENEHLLDDPITCSFLNDNLKINSLS